MSQGSSRSSPFVIVVLPGKPTTVPCSFFQASTRSTSSPSVFLMPPPVSETAMIVEPSSAMSRAAM